MNALLTEIRNCEYCIEHLPAGPRPVLQASPQSRIVIIGQAPGRIVHESGIPWKDRSGDRLRDWLGVDETSFYDPQLFALIPMGFCFPGMGKSGDLPPRPECAPLWHERLFKAMPCVELILLFGMYSQAYYLGKRRKKNLTETVVAWREYYPEFLPMPHPSPRNQRWWKRNPWFEVELLPELKGKVGELLGGE